MFDLYKNICHIFSKNLVFHVKINFYVQVMNLCITFYFHYVYFKNSVIFHSLSKFIYIRGFPSKGFTIYLPINEFPIKTDIIVFLSCHM